VDAGKEAAVHISADLANEVEAEAGEAGLAALCKYKPGFLLHSCKFGHLILLRIAASAGVLIALE